MADSEKPVKRSRFDQKDPEPKRSRFDRRSRSPPTHRQEARERSPLPASGEDAAPKAPVDPAAAAAAAAAKINAQIQARKGVQHVDVPPVQSPGDPSAPSAAGGSTGGPGHAVNGEMYVHDGDYIKDIEVNDLRNRYLLTKSSTQKMIQDETGADITTRGNYYPNKSMATPANPPLYLHVTSTSKAGLEAAVAKIDELIQQELPQLVDERRFRRRDREREPEPQVERDEFGRRKWPEEKIPIEMESVPGFNLRAKVVGQGGQYVKYIQQETGCRVQIKGRGSGFTEVATGRESDEDMYLHVAGPDPAMVEKAKELCVELLVSVKEMYEEWKTRPRFQGQGNGYGEGGRHGGDRYRGEDRHRGDGHHSGDGHGSYGGGGAGGGSYGGYGSSENHAYNSSASGDPSNAANSQEYLNAYAQYYGGSDPYAAYGGYANYVALYQHYYGGQGQQGQTQGSPAPPGVPGQSSASPPPPPPPPPPGAPGDSAAPPPPPSASPPGTSGAYGSVPPPPGL